MPLTIDIPDDLARQLEPERDHLAAIMTRGLRRSWSGRSDLRREIISFLARRPRTAEILEFRPSEVMVARAQDLLHRNQESPLGAGEEAELDEICEVDRFFTPPKAHVLAQISPPM